VAEKAGQAKVTHQCQSAPLDFSYDLSSFYLNRYRKIIPYFEEKDKHMRICWQCDANVGIKRLMTTLDIAGELVSQAKNGVAFMIKASTNLDFANNILM
jgi:hypothetical protein